MLSSMAQIYFVPCFCTESDAYLTLTLVGFVVREVDKPHHRVLSGQE